MDPLIEEEIMAEEEPSTLSMINPLSFMLKFLASYGWFLIGGAAVTLYVAHRLRPVLAKWQQAREDAEYHKNPDVALARMEAVQRAREIQQQKLLEASQRALELQKEREERKRAEMAERLEKYGTAAGQKLGSGEKDDDYMPLSAGASTSSYRPPKKSKCGGGGCGR